MSVFSRWLSIGLFTLNATSTICATLKPKAIKASKFELIAADQIPMKGGKTEFGARDGLRTVKANGLPKHKIGQFPNPGNPYELKAQKYEFKVPLKPVKAKSITPLKLNMNFGVTMTGIPLDPSTDIWFNGNSKSGWNYEALGGAINLGIDENHAHLTKEGAYHFHGLPTELLRIYGLTPGDESAIIGWAADGFAIYALYGEGGKSVKSSYRLKQGKRPIGGEYDGTFVQDYEYVKGLGDLDECNGKMYKGQYAYFLTMDFPVIPRCFKGSPHKSFLKNK